MKVICLGDWDGLTKGKVYDVIVKHEHGFRVLNDRGREMNYCKSTFKIVE